MFQHAFWAFVCITLGLFSLGILAPSKTSKARGNFQAVGIALLFVGFALIIRIWR